MPLPLVLAASETGRPCRSLSVDPQAVAQSPAPPPPGSRGAASECSRARFQSREDEAFHLVVRGHGVGRAVFRRPPGAIARRPVRRLRRRDRRLAASSTCRGRIRPIRHTDAPHRPKSAHPGSDSDPHRGSDRRDPAHRLLRRRRRRRWWRRLLAASPTRRRRSRTSGRTGRRSAPCAPTSARISAREYERQ